MQAGRVTNRQTGTHIHTHNKHIHKCTQAYIHTYSQAYRQTVRRTYIYHSKQLAGQTYIHPYIYTYIYTGINTYIQTGAHTYRDTTTSAHIHTGIR